MEAKQELAKIEKKYKKLAKKEKKLDDRKREIHLTVSKREREKAAKERTTFFHNLQVSNVKSLLKSSKKRALEPDTVTQPVEAAASAEIRDFVFQLADVFTQITAHLGPMEYFMFSRTSKALRDLLDASFTGWARSFLCRVEQETPQSKAFAVRKEDLLGLLGEYQTYSNVKSLRVAFLPVLLGQWHKMFATYRPQGALKADRDASFWPHSVRCIPLFVHNKETQEITRFRDHNILVAQSRVRDVNRQTTVKFERKHGFKLIRDIVDGVGEEDKEDVPLLSYYRYDELAQLKLARLTECLQYDRVGTLERPFFLVEPEEDKISRLKNTPLCIITMNRVFKCGKWKGPLFHDEYECRLIIQGRPVVFIDFSANQISARMLKFFIASTAK